MYEIIRVKEGDRQFQISVPHGTYIDFEIMTRAFEDALRRYTLEYTSLREQYVEAQKELSILRMNSKDHYRYDPIYKESLKNPCMEIKVRGIDEDIVKGVIYADK